MAGLQTAAKAATTTIAGEAGVAAEAAAARATARVADASSAAEGKVEARNADGPHLYWPGNVPEDATYLSREATPPEYATGEW